MTTPSPVPQWAVDAAPKIAEDLCAISSIRHGLFTPPELYRILQKHLPAIIARHAPDDQDRRRLDWLFEYCQPGWGDGYDRVTMECRQDIDDEMRKQAMREGGR